MNAAKICISYQCKCINYSNKSRPFSLPCDIVKKVAVQKNNYRQCPISTANFHSNYLHSFRNRISLVLKEGLLLTLHHKIKMQRRSVDLGGVFRFVVRFRLVAGFQRRARVLRVGEKLVVIGHRYIICRYYFSCILTIIN